MAEHVLELEGSVLDVHVQAQQNILELNKSRLNALEELKAARMRIAELGMPS
jgi:hypothetical protein